MAVTTNAFSAANLAATIPEVWSDIVNTSKFPQAVLTNFCVDLSDYVDEGGDTIHVPEIYTNQLSSSTQSTEGTEITPDTPAQVDDTISVDTHEYVAFMMGDKTMRQVARKYNLVELYAREAQGVLMNVIEAAIAALWSSLDTSYGDTTNGLTDPDVRRGISNLESANFSTMEMALFVHPEVYWTQIMGISKYYTKDTSTFDSIRDGLLGGEEGGMRRSFKGILYDIPVFTTTNIVESLQTYRNLLLTPNALAWGIGPMGGEIETEFGPTPLRFRVQSSYELRNLALLNVVDFYYGVGVLRSEAGIVLNSSNAYVTS